MCARTDDPTQHDHPRPMTRAERLAQTGDCPAEFPDTCPDVNTCPVHDDGTLFCDHEPNDDGTACRYCYLPAERADLSPDALALLIAYEATDHDGTRARWTVALTQADINRRRTLDRYRVTEEAVATVAAVAGIVADRRALPLNTARPAAWRAVEAGRVDGDDRQPGNDLGAFARLAEVIARQREASDVWADIQHSRSDDPHRYAAHHDAYTERELIAGWTAADGRTWPDLPPLYRAGLDSAGPYPNPARVTPTGPGHVTGLQPPRSGAHV